MPIEHTTRTVRPYTTLVRIQPRPPVSRSRLRDPAPTARGTRQARSPTAVAVSVVFKNFAVTQPVAHEVRELEGAARTPQAPHETVIFGDVVWWMVGRVTRGLRV